MNTYVFTKDASDIVNQVALGLQSGETVTSIVVAAATPVTANSAQFQNLSGNADPLQFKITSGDTGITYGFPITVTTNLRVFTLTVACSVLADTYSPYPVTDPGSYQDLLGEIEAGKSGLATTMFSFPPSLDVSGGYVTWDLLDQAGTIYSSGNAYDYSIVSNGISNTAIAKSVVNVPADIPVSVDTPYQLRYTLTLPQAVAGAQGIYYSFESIFVRGFPTMQVGAVDSIEMAGDPAMVQLVTETLYANYVVEIWLDGSLLASLQVPNPERIANGYFVAATIDTSTMPVTLIPYQIIWKFWNDPRQLFREKAALWLVNDSILQAVEDVKSKVNKARQTLYGTPDSQFPSTEIMKWLRRGMDTFNGAAGQFTSFTMTNAKGVVREYWLLCAEKASLEAQYLMEGEKAFNFSGANITLDVDRTSYLDNAASKIQSQLDNELKPIKQNLIIKGQTSGTGAGPNGDGDFSILARGAMGSVGITLTVATLYGGYGRSRPVI